MRRKKILIIDARPLFREGLKGVLRLSHDAIDFTDVGNDYELTRSMRHTKEFDLILVHERFLSVGDHGLILAYLYKTHNPIAVTCDCVTDKLKIKLTFFNISAVLKHKDSVEVIVKCLSDLLHPENQSNNVYQCQRAEVGQPRDAADRYRPENEILGTKLKLDYLTRRQRDVLNYLKVGLMNKEIAFEMGICESTVKRHVSDIFKKLRVQNRTQLAVSITC